MPPLIACPSCESHAKVSEDLCPHCGAPLRDGGGRVLRSATAAVLGLVAVTSTTSCRALEPVDEYGPAPTHDVRPPATSSAATSATASPSASAAHTGHAPVAEYGPAPTLTASAGVGGDVPMDEYGPPPTVSPKK